MKKLLIASLLCFGLSIAAKAASIPYPNIGTEAPVNTFVAASSGDIKAYFYASDAGYSSTIGLLVNNLTTGVTGLPNHASAYGDMIDLGWANAGDVLVFQLIVADTGSSLYSDPTMNSDGKNHVYSTNFVGDPVIPAGVYVAFEDTIGLGDVDYNDHQFVFTNVSSRVPEASSTLLLSGLALASLAALRRRK
jgi:hypothetical protein